MTIELIDTPARFAALGADWDALYRDDPEAHVFLSHRWLSDLHRRRPGVCTFVWRDGSADAPLGAALPLRRELVLDRERRRFRGELMMAGSHWADYTGALCRPGLEERALPALGAALLELPWERLRLDDLRLSPDRLTLLLSALDPERHACRERHPRDNGGATRLDVAPRVALPARFEDWLAGLGANTRQRLRRHRRRLEADPALSVRDSVAATRAADLAAFRSLWLARWGEAKGADAELKADKYVAILADGLADGAGGERADGLADGAGEGAENGPADGSADGEARAPAGTPVRRSAEPSADPRLRLTLLCERGEPVAVNAVYEDPVRRTASFYVGARDDSFRTVPAGLLLHAHAIERAIGRGHRVYDFLRGDEDYKHALGAADEPLVSRHFRPTPPTPAHVLLDGCHRDRALAMIDEALEEARADTVGKLYSQLLESWPGESLVLARYRAWLAAPGRKVTALA